MDVEEIVRELYGLRPEEFVAARDDRAARARKAKDTAAARRIAALRRPTVAAWASNLFVRQRPRDAERLRALGETLREAHRTLDADALRGAAAEQHRVIGALARETATLARDAGHPLGEAARRELEQIFHAVLADPDISEQWATATLARTPEASFGFGTVAPEAVARRAAVRERADGEEGPGADEGQTEARGGRGTGDTAARRPGTGTGGTAGRRPGTDKRATAAERPPTGRAAAGKAPSARAARQDAERRQRLAKARAAEQEAAAEARRWQREREAAEEARQAAQERVAEAEERVARLEEELREARTARREARAAATEADAAAKEAAQAARQAHRAAERAARELARLTDEDAS
ncbi:hypothetical protein [Streptomyces sp. enrichment culture]|uniref:hypothetical protein n=1 Tax=Streptomyces sp. enrichment culture TaxID=1795815 RepID=UPI003F563B68